MAINKVIYGGDTLIDLTSDTVEASDVMAGVSFHSADGVARVGSYVPSVTLSACSAKGSANVTLNQNTPKKLTLNTMITNTDSDAFEISNGGIKCKKAGVVQVSGACYIASTGAGTMGTYIFNGSSEMTSGMGYAASGNVSYATTVAPMYVEISAGTIFYLYARHSASKGTAYSGNAATHLSLMYVD